MDVWAKHSPADANGVRIAELDEMTYRRELWSHKPITDFWRVGRGTVKRLAKRFIFTMGDIARASLERPEVLYKDFGIDAEILMDHAWGRESVGMSDIKNYRSEAKSLGSGQVLHCAYTYEKARIVVREMAEALALDLFQKSLVASSVTLHVGYDIESLELPDFDGEVVTDYYGRPVPKPAHGTTGFDTYAGGGETNSGEVIAEAVVSLFDKIVNHKWFFRRMNVTANNTIPVSQRQPGLFDEETDSQKEESLQNARLKIINKFGKNALLKGMDFEEGATTRDRNAQIGGHKA